MYDLRRYEDALCVLKSELGAFRAACYSPNGNVLALGEAEDYVHLYDVVAGYMKRQTYDYFGKQTQDGR